VEVVDTLWRDLRYDARVHHRGDTLFGTGHWRKCGVV
jgi:hypothetical protein